ncbi:MAG: hypothetical protein WBM03_04835 [Steroidobacteraceae bacterium]
MTAIAQARRPRFAGGTDPPAATTAGRLIAFLAALFAAWLAARPYEGIVLDAQLYTLQTLATMNPTPLAGDLFLRFGSQNSFTLFPHLVAPLVELFGIEAAAAIVTISSALLLLAAGGLLAKHLTSVRSAWLAVGLLLTIPGWYGAGEVLRYDEMYLNARVPAEALSILALACAAKRRWLLAFLTAGIAVMIHPVMAAATCGLLVLVGIDAIAPERYRRIAGPSIALAGALLLALAAYLLSVPAEPGRELWISSMRSRTTFLFLQDWRIEDWLQNGLGIASLCIATSVLNQATAARVAALTAVLGALGIALAALASMGGHFDLLLLGQTWRWAWLARFVALILLPATLSTLWKSGHTGRACALLLGSGWLLVSHFGGAVAMLAALLWFARRRFDESTEAALLKGAWTVAAGTAVLLVAFGAQALPLAMDSNAATRWVQRLVNFSGVAGPLACVVTLAWHLTLRSRSKTAPLAVGLLAAVALAGLLPYQLFPKVESRYSESNQAKFGAWRGTIPQTAEVLWHEDPVAVWVLLQRRSFLSGSQSAGLLYSRELTREFSRRSATLAALASPGWWTLAAIDREDEPKALTSRILREICREPALGYVVGAIDVGNASGRVEWPTRGQHVFLYDCAAFRDEAER